MNEIVRILDQLRRAWDGEAWHGPALWPMLADVSAEEAEVRPIAAAHTIAELVFHLAFWKGVARRRVGGENIVPPDAEGWPAQGIAGETDWNERREFLQTKQRELEETVATLSNDRLAVPVAGKNYNVYILLHGIIQHDAYHAGQIAILKRAIRK